MNDGLIAHLEVAVLVHLAETPLCKLLIGCPFNVLIQQLDLWNTAANVG
jgi:hypothetical protein